jgi:hypothetical protein
VAATAEQVRETAKLLTQLEKTRKTLRLYQTITRLPAPAAELGALSTPLELGRLAFAVGDALRLDDEWSPSPRIALTAWSSCFRDGVRRLTLLPGLEPSVPSVSSRRSIKEHRRQPGGRPRHPLSGSRTSAQSAIRRRELDEHQRTAPAEQLAAGSLPVGQPSQGVEKVRIDDLKKLEACCAGSVGCASGRSGHPRRRRRREDPLVVSVEPRGRADPVRAADERRAIRWTVLESVWQALSAGG